MFDGSQEVYNKLWDIYLGHCRHGKNDGSYNIFKTFLDESGIYSSKKEMEMVYLYRIHFPKIALYPWVVPLFDELKERGLSIGVITNGRATVQLNKLKALNVLKHTDKYIVCDVLGEKYYKPFPTAYRILLDWMNMEPHQCLYVDDLQENVNASMQLGMEGIRVVCVDDVPKAIKERLR
jgi:HAD superfamily hydrolase (TIGR01509 family)